MTTKRKICSSIKELLYFLSALIVMSNRVFGANVNDNLRRAIGIIWIIGWLVAVRGRIRKDYIYRHFWLTFFPFLVFLLYSLMIWLVNGVDSFRYVSRAFSTVLWLLVFGGFAVSGFYFFRRKVIDLLFWASVISYFVGSICYAIVIGGFGEYIIDLALGTTGASSVNYIMEVHELTFTMGIFCLYYWFFDKDDKKFKLKSVISLLLVFLGLKRIELIALIIVALFYLLLIRKGKYLSYKGWLLALIFSISSYGFLFLVKSNILSLLAIKYNIEFSGRLQMYSYAAKYYELSPFFTGRGFMYMSRLFNDLYNQDFRLNGHRVAASIHSNIISMYSEVGFILFFIWIIYIFWISTKILKRYSAKEAIECYLLVSIFMFILYFTDNTLTYNTTQMLYFLVPLVVNYHYKVDVSTQDTMIDERRI